MFAVEGDKTEVLRWLIAEGFDVNAADLFETTPLMAAAECGYADCVQILLNAGADPSMSTKYGDRPIKKASNVEVVRLLLAVGEDLSDIDDDVRRELAKVRPGDIRATRKEYQAGKHREFGRSNPQRMDKPFWNAMVHSGCNAYQARQMFADTDRFDPPPVWCYQRFGRTTTLLPDGRIIEIAGEHEDSYDPDFCIYNDVVVYDGKGDFEIWGYPKKVFPPTDFHSATLVGDYIYIIGSLGYQGERKPGETPVFRLHCRTFQMELVQTRGEKPGWISRHKARYEESSNRIYVSGGKIMDQDYVPNTSLYALDLNHNEWTRLNP